MSYLKVLDIAYKTTRGRLSKLEYDHYAVTNNPFDINWQITENPFHNTGAGTIVVIADGVREFNTGDKASAIACCNVKRYFHSRRSSIVNNDNIFMMLKEAILYSHNAILQFLKTHADCPGMSTTLLIAWIYKARLYTGWSGKSRVYHYRDNIGLTQINKDHSVVQSLADSGEITTGDIINHPKYNLVTQKLGDASHPPKPDFAAVNLGKNDIIVMCSDGLNRSLTDFEIETIVKANEFNTKSGADLLIQKANEQGGLDSATVILIKVLGSITDAEMQQPKDVVETVNISIQLFELYKKAQLMTIVLTYLFITAVLIATLLVI